MIEWEEERIICGVFSLLLAFFALEHGFNDAFWALVLLACWMPFALRREPEKGLNTVANAYDMEKKRWIVIRPDGKKVILTMDDLEVLSDAIGITTDRVARIIEKLGWDAHPWIKQNLDMHWGDDT